MTSYRRCKAMVRREWIGWRRLAAAALAGGALLVAACGGGDYAGDGGPSGNVEADREASAVGAPSADEAALSNVDATGGEQLSQPQVQDRKIVRTATLELQVEDVVGAVQQIDDVATTAGGFVSSSNVFVDTGGDGAGDVHPTRTASVTIRIPADAYSSVMSQLRGIAKETVSETS